MNMLKDMSGGHALDVATGKGGFAGFLAQSLKDYGSIVGIDASERVIHAAQNAADRDDIRFVQMDGERLGFDSKAFDTVCISNSLHHMANLSQVLGEMTRVLRSGGRCIISEMYRDGQTEPQLTHVYLHHWWAEVDSVLGITHNETFSRQKIVDIVEGLGLSSLAFHDYAELDTNPKDEALLKELDGIIDMYTQRAEGPPSFEALKRRGEALGERVHDVGFQGATHLVIVGEK